MCMFRSGTKVLQRQGGFLELPKDGKLQPLRLARPGLFSPSQPSFHQAFTCILFQRSWLSVFDRRFISMSDSIGASVNVIVELLETR